MITKTGYDAKFSICVLRRDPFFVQRVGTCDTRGHTRPIYGAGPMDKNTPSRQKRPQLGKKSAKIDTQKELTAENQSVSSFLGAPGGI